MNNFGTASYLPRSDDYHPALRRQHGTTHPDARMVDGQVRRRSNPCVCPTCERNRDNGRGEGHIDKAANVLEWMVDHRIAPARRQRATRQ